MSWSSTTPVSLPVLPSWVARGTSWSPRLICLWQHLLALPIEYSHLSILFSYSLNTLSSILPLFPSSFWRGQQSQPFFPSCPSPNSSSWRVLLGHLMWSRPCPCHSLLHDSYSMSGWCPMLLTALNSGTFICFSAYVSHVSSSQAMKAIVTETLWDGEKKKVSLQYSLNVMKDSLFKTKR